MSQSKAQQEFAKTAGYTHTVRYTKRHNDYGIVEQEFNTTTDAVKIYERSLAAQERRGKILSFEIVAL